MDSEQNHMSKIITAEASYQISGDRSRLKQHLQKRVVPNITAQIRKPISPILIYHRKISRLEDIIHHNAV